MKVILIHPPMYPVNHKFYNLLAQKVELIVYQICEHPVHHTSWTSNEIRNDKLYYRLKIFSHGSVTTLKTLNPSFIFDIIKEKPDIVISIAFWMPSLYISFLKKIYNFKYIILTNAISQTEINISKNKIFIRKLIAKNVDFFISASNLTTKYLNSSFPKNKVVLSMQTTDIESWIKNLEAIENKITLRQKLKITQDKIIMLGVGNYTEKKNWISVIKLLPKLDNIIFILVGYGELEDEYKKIAKELKVEDKLKVVGKKMGRELLEFYKLSDFLIFPSLYDQFGFVVPEALASGLPVICTKNAGSESLIEDGYNGITIDPYNYDENDILKVIKELSNLKINAKSSIQKYTLENKVEEFIDIFKKVIL